MLFPLELQQALFAARDNPNGCLEIVGKRFKIINRYCEGNLVHLIVYINDDRVNDNRYQKILKFMARQLGAEVFQIEGN